jgi:uncharacterized membrane protein
LKSDLTCEIIINSSQCCSLKETNISLECIWDNTEKKCKTKDIKTNINSIIIGSIIIGIIISIIIVIILIIIIYRRKHKQLKINDSNNSERRN